MFELGKLGCVHFIDMNTNKLATDLPYQAQLKKIDKASFDLA